VSALGRRIALLVAVLACVLPLGSAQADELRPRDNVATAVTTEDGGSTFDFSWEVRKQRGGVVDNLNQAQAGARCSDCRATAIAFQIVLVSGPADDVSPVNRSLAFTDQCTRCVVYAGARQFVRVVDAPVKFTDAGREQLAAVRQALRALEGQDLSADELAAAVDAQKARVLDVLRDEVVLKSDPDTEADVIEQHHYADDDVS
jgi:putative peptide zinc metalloprotease protein